MRFPALRERYKNLLARDLRTWRCLERGWELSSRAARYTRPYVFLDSSGAEPQQIEPNILMWIDLSSYFAVLSGVSADSNHIKIFWVSSIVSVAFQLTSA